MASISQTTRYKSQISNLDEIYGNYLSDSNLFEEKSVHSPESVFLEAFKQTLENYSGNLTPETPEQAPVRFDSSLFDSSLVIQDFSSLTVLSVFANKDRRGEQSLTTVVETLVDIIRENENEFFASLTAEDYQNLAATRNKLIDVIGEDENHLLEPLLAFIDNLIRIRDGVDSVENRKHTRSSYRPEHDGRPENRPRVKLTELLEQEVETSEDNLNVNTDTSETRRPEHVGRPENRPRVKLAELIEQEIQNMTSENNETVAPVSPKT